MTQSNDLSQRVDRTENQIIDLQLTANLILQAIDKNSTDIAQLIEVSRVLQVSQIRTDEAIQDTRSTLVSVIEVSRVLQASQIRTDEAIQDIRSTLASVNATVERMDRLFDYLIRRDQGQSE